MFLRNYWYVAATPAEITGAPLARTVLGEPIVLYRAGDGRAVAMEDRCCHRQAPLSLGRVTGNNLRCGYHGMTFNPEGICVAIPGQKTIPTKARVRTYPLVERWRFVWIWMGAPEQADPDAIPDIPFNTDPDWSFVGGYLNFKCHYQLIVDNLLDLSHETFLHAKTIGSDHIADTPLAKVKRDDIGPLAVSPLGGVVSVENTVTATRWMLCGSSTTTAIR